MNLAPQCRWRMSGRCRRRTALSGRSIRWRITRTACWRRRRRLDKPITVVTGSRKGIGRFLAEHYINQGHVVVGCSRGDVDFTLEGYQHFSLDVSDEKAVTALFTSVRKQHGRLDNLINNAGVASMNHSMLTPLTTVQKVLNTNVVGTFLFCREAAKLMKA